MANSRFYSSTAAVTTLQVTAAPSDTSIQVASSSGFPGSFPFTLSLDYGAANEELVDVTAGGPNIFTVTRAVDGTSASTHNAGATVRHVSSARDFTDSRTHEASSTAHGISGSFVDTVSTQTLSNKTLTSPIVNNPTVANGSFSGTQTFSGTPTFSAGAALSGTYTGNPTFSGTVTFSGGGSLTGTFTGNPTFSGNPSFTGTPNFSNQLIAQRTFATGATYRASVSGDTNDRHYVDAAGAHYWGTGSAATDVTLARTGVGFLGVTGSLTTSGSVTATGNLLGADLSLSNITWTSYTPTVTGGGLATYTTRTGYYYKIGKLVHVVVFLDVNTPGSGSTVLSIDMPSSVDRSTRQVMTAQLDNLSSANNGSGQLLSFTGGTGATFDRLRNSAGANLTGSDLLVNGLVTIQGWYREA